MTLIYESLGWVGSGFFLYSYYKLIIKKWESTAFSYHIFNILGACCFVINGTFYSAWAVVFINVTWGLIACYGLYQAMKQK